MYKSFIYREKCLRFFFSDPDISSCGPYFEYELAKRRQALCSHSKDHLVEKVFSLELSYSKRPLLFDHLLHQCCKCHNLRHPGILLQFSMSRGDLWKLSFSKPCNKNVMIYFLLKQETRLLLPWCQTI